MLGTLGTVMLIISLLLGGSGVTVAAAQGSMPDQMLYPVKTWSEQVRVEFSAKDYTRLQLALDLANRRAEEMQYMLEEGKVPAEALQQQYQAQIEQMLQLAAGQEDAEMTRSLEQIRDLLRLHLQQFDGLGSQADPVQDTLLLRTRTMLQDRLKLCDDGIGDPETFRNTLRNREEFGEPQNSEGPGPVEEPAGSPSLNGESNGRGPHDESIGPGPNEDPGGPGMDEDSSGPGMDEDSGGPGESMGEDAGESYGPGDGTGEGVGPGDCECDGSGPDDQDNDSNSGGNEEAGPNDDSGSDHSGGNDEAGDSGSDYGDMGEDSPGNGGGR